MKEIINMTLAKAAAKSGGDKYAGKVKGEDFSIYLPQSLSRPCGKPAYNVAVTIDVGE